MTTTPRPAADLDDEVQEYIDLLHDRIQFLTAELEDAERTILELRQERADGDEGSIDRDGGPISHDEGPTGRDVDPELVRLFEYVASLYREFDENRSDVELLASDFAEICSEYVEGGGDLDNASLALVALLLRHERLDS